VPYQEFLAIDLVAGHLHHVRHTVSAARHTECRGTGKEEILKSRIGGRHWRQ
jgi:hypothetical protein